MIFKVQRFARQRGWLQLGFNHCGSFLFVIYLLNVGLVSSLMITLIVRMWGFSAEANWRSESGCKAEGASEEDWAAESWDKSPRLSDQWDRGTAGYTRLRHCTQWRLGRPQFSLSNYGQKEEMLLFALLPQVNQCIKRSVILMFSTTCQQSSPSVVPGPRWRTAGAESCSYRPLNSDALRDRNYSLTPHKRSVGTARH